jgi:plasmid stabilization system protein ParE
MPTKQLDWAESALDELGSGIAFYAERNPVAALRMLEEINHAAQSLVATEIPSKGRSGRLAGTRELLVSSHTPYILVFADVKHPQPAIQILRVIHTSRKFP